MCGKKIIGFSLVFVVVIFTGCTRGAPKGSKSKTHYDQKQTGDYNIRLNLKDFQIVAIVDDSLGDLGVSTHSFLFFNLIIIYYFRVMIIIMTTQS